MNVDPLDSRLEDKLERARLAKVFSQGLEAEVGHDVIAFLTSVAEKVGPAARHIHYGLTSSDVIDTALALRLTRAMDLLLTDLAALQQVLERSAHRRAAPPAPPRRMAEFLESAIERWR